MNATKIWLLNHASDGASGLDWAAAGPCGLNGDSGLDWLGLYQNEVSWLSEPQFFPSADEQLVYRMSAAGS